MVNPLKYPFNTSTTPHFTFLSFVVTVIHLKSHFYRLFVSWHCSYFLDYVNVFLTHGLLSFRYIYEINLLKVSEPMDTRQANSIFW